MLHPDLQKLLDYALQDGELSEKEREILHKKALELGEDTDVLEMVIEGALQKINKNIKEEKQKDFACPNCGSSIPSSSIKCKFCGFEISKKTVTGKNFLDALNKQLEEINKRQAEAELADKWGLKGPLAAGVSAAQQKASIISTFSMPNDKENLLEFFYFCDSNYDSHSNTWGFGTININAQANKILGPAWAGKAKLAYNKLKRFENEDEEIKELLENYKKKYYQAASDLKAASIITNQGKGKAVLMGLNQTGVILFFALLVLCFPTCWLPFVIPACKAG
jgi:hypothetical protein